MGAQRGRRDRYACGAGREADDLARALAGDEGTEAIIVDLAPLTAPPTESRNDLAPGPEQQQSKARLMRSRKPEENSQEKIESPPPVPDAEFKYLPRRSSRPRSRKSNRRTAPGNDIATAPKAVRGASRFMASQNRPAGRETQRLSAFCPRAARDRHRTTRLYARSQRKGRYEPHRADVGFCGSGSGNNRYRAARAALPAAAAEHAR